MEKNEKIIITSIPLHNPNDYFNPLEITDEDIDELINRIENQRKNG